MAQRMNSDLANAYGNLAQRSLSMAFKNCDAQIPVPGSLTDVDQALVDKASKLRDQVGRLLGPAGLPQGVGGCVVCHWGCE